MEVTMGSISQIIDTSVALYQKSPNVVVDIVGKPGEGKSDACVQIGKKLGFTDDRILVVHINNHDVVDFTGVPSVDDGMTKFNPSEMFYRFREGTGGGMIVLEELHQSSTHHQTWAAGFMLERETPCFKLDKDVRIIATGNRAEDRAGAKPLLGHLNDRMYHFDVETSLDDWCAWALEHNVNPLGIAFLRLRPNLLNDYDPNKRSNPTQRSWTKLFNEVPMELPSDLYLMACEGKVGEGAAAEWVAAKDMMAKMPNIDVVRMHPETTETPKEPAVSFAIATSLSMTSTVDSFENDMKYITRMKKEFAVVYLTDALKLNPAIQTTKAFTEYAVKNQDIFKA
tara:strand:+ start:12741 stop:13760 length:1020 start_codon:yes stop_codon:yes gene_type:complete